MDGGAIKTSGTGDHSVVDEGSVGRALERMHDAFDPSWCQLEKRSTSARCRSAFAGSAIEISGCVSNQVADGTGAVRTSLKAVQHAFGPRAVVIVGEFVDCAEIIRPVVVGRAIKVARLIQQQSAVGKTRVRHAFECINGHQPPFSPAAGDQVKNHPTPVSTTGGACTEEAAATVGK